MPQQAGKVHVIVVEDDASDVVLLRLALEKAAVDCELTVIENRVDALAFVRRHACGSVPDLIVLDLNLPEHSGFDILQAIRASEALADVTMAIMSSSPSPATKARLEESGIALHIEKPSNLRDFLDIGFLLRDLLEKGNKIQGRKNGSGIGQAV